MNYQDLISACQSDWNDYINHDFVEQLACGQLPQAVFQHYLQQDFLFLKQYARAYALAIYKAQTLSEMRHALPSVHALLDSEIQHHVDYCRQFGVTEEQMEQTDEAPGTVAYTRYVLDTGMAGDLVDLYVALAPCAIGYAQIGSARQQAETTVLEGNPYASWLTMYGGEEFQQGVAGSIEHINQLLAPIAPDSPRGQRLIKIFRTATRMEVAFWQQSFSQS